MSKRRTIEGSLVVLCLLTLMYQISRSSTNLTTTLPSFPPPKIASEKHNNKPSPSETTTDTDERPPPVGTEHKKEVIKYPGQPNTFYTGEIDQVVGVNNENNAVKGVIIFLHGGRWHSYFVQQNLPRLERWFLKCYPYPIHVFHEDINTEQKKGIRKLVPSTNVAFERVDFSKLPPYTSEGELKGWMTEGYQYKFQGRGYRMMCRFWAGFVWQMPSLDKYDVYLRLDTDSVISKPMKLDLFQYFVKNKCEYGFNRLKGENPYVLTGLWETFLRWAKVHENDFFPTAALRYVEELAKDPTNGKYWGPMYYNNFEMGYMRLKRHMVYQSLFGFLDSEKPYGILRYRWGDAPIHTLGVWAVLAVEAVKDGDGGQDFIKERLCNITQSVAPYRHAALKLPPMSQENCVKEES